MMRVVVVSVERCVSVGCVDGGRGRSPVCVPVLAHVRVCVHVLDRVLTKIADEGTERMEESRVVGRRHRTTARPRTVGGQGLHKQRGPR